MTETEKKFAEFVRLFCEERNIDLTPEKIDCGTGYEYWQVYSDYGNRVATHTFHFDDMDEEEQEYYTTDIAFFIIANNMEEVMKKVIIPNM